MLDDRSSSPKGRSTLRALRPSTSSSTTARSPRSRRLRRRFRRRASALIAGRSCCRLRRRPHPSRQGPYLAAARQSDRRFPGALAAVIEDRAANWTAADVAAADGVQPARRLRARHAAIRTHIDSVGAQTRISWPVFAEARERWRGRIDAAGLAALQRRFRPRPRAHGRHRGDGRRARIGNSRRGRPTWSRDLREASDAVRARRAQGLGPRFPCRRKRRSGGALARVIAEMAIERRFPGRILVGHCCSLARQDDDERARDDRRCRARGDQRRLLADVQYFSPGPPSPAARRAGAASPRCTNSGRRAST